MNKAKRRHNTGFGYIGFGNNQSVFNRKPRKVFSETKNKLNFESQKKHQLKFSDKKLSLIEKNSIKNKIRKDQKERFIKALIITILIIFVLLLLFQFNRL